MQSNKALKLVKSVIFVSYTCQELIGEKCCSIFVSDPSSALTLRVRFSVTCHLNSYLQCI